MVMFSRGSRSRKTIDHLHMLKESTLTDRASNILELRKSNLGNDGTKLPGSSRDTVSGRSVTGRENLSRNYKSGCVGT